jgi:5-methylcytosine-specific restriction enzyme A
MGRHRNKYKDHLYHSKRWQSQRKMQLDMYPLCQWCEREGRITPASLVHHVQQHHLDPVKFYDNDFVSLCSDCHDVEAQGIESRGYSVNVGSDGWPIDALHPANRGRREEGGGDGAK